MSSGFFDLRGRTAFVAGAYGDLGAAIARALVASGVRVAVAGRDPAKLVDACRIPRRRCAGGGDGGKRRRLDPLGRERSAASKLSTLDFLVNCVGIFEEERVLDATPGELRSRDGGQLSRGDVPLAGRCARAGRQANARPACPSAVGALAARHAGPRLLVLLRQQGRPRDARSPARRRARTARHHRQRCRPDRRAHGDGRALVRRSGPARQAALAHPARPRRGSRRRRRDGPVLPRTRRRRS